MEGKTVIGCLNRQLNLSRALSRRFGPSLRIGDKQMAAAREAASTPLVPHCFALSSCRSCGDRRRGAAAHSVSAAGAALRAACRMWPPLASRALPEPAGDGHVVALESRRQAARTRPSDSCRCAAVADGAGGALQAPEAPPCLSRRLRVGLGGGQLLVVLLARLRGIARAARPPAFPHLVGGGSGRHARTGRDYDRERGGAVFLLLCA